MHQQSSRSGGIAAVVIVLIVAAGAMYVTRRPAPSPSSDASTDASGITASANRTSESIEHPIGQADVAPASASTVQLPALDGSDDSVTAALASLTGDNGLSSLLMQPQVIQRIVATVDALPRRGLNRVMLPLHPPKGSFATEAGAGGTVMSAQNDARYAPYMQLVQNIDPGKLVAWYVHAYPLFQQAYRQLGYPKGYFNDRVIVAIDNLLATPNLAQRPSLALVNGYYRYTDPQLESLSAGQRVMLRAGPDNEDQLKTRLREIRKRLVGRSFQGNMSPEATSSAR